MLNLKKLSEILELNKFVVKSGTRRHGEQHNFKEYQFLEFENEIYSCIIEQYGNNTGSHYVINKEDNQIIICDRILNSSIEKIQKSILNILKFFNVISTDLGMLFM